MSLWPRVAIGTIQPAADGRPVLWGLMDLLERSGLQVQCFRSTATFANCDVATSITGQAVRHLDSWVMTPALCRQAFFRGARDSDLSLVEGRFDRAGGDDQPGGRLDVVCGWLNLPRIAVLDVALVRSCCLPERPAADVLLLDGVVNSHELHRWQTSLQALWGIPVLGGLAIYPCMRETLAALAPDRPAPRELCRELGLALEKHCPLAALRQLAERHDFPVEVPQPAPLAHVHPPVTVAMAYDDVFRGYFADTLELLEALGVRVVDFSPLRDECLPADVDIVYFGCGHPERFVPQLTQNQCMLLALRNHLCAGKRMYAEGGGLAYLCQHLEVPGLGRAPMVGAFPAVARYARSNAEPQPCEATLARNTWLGNAGMRLRGYRNTCWRFEPSGNVQALVAEPGHEFDLLARHQAIGSQLHLNFAAQPDFLRCFSQHHPAALAWAAR